MDKLLKVTKKRCTWLGKEPDDDFRYGSFKDTDMLVDSTNVEDRIRMAKLGYGVDKLKDDVNPRVRVAVAMGGYYTQQLIKDSSAVVRIAAKTRI